MKKYKDVLIKILNEGDEEEYRNGKRISLFDQRLTFDLREGMPVVSIKETKWRTAFAEMLWFLSGSSDTKELTDKGVPNIWKQWEDPETHSIGPLYGAALRHAPNNGRPMHYSYTRTAPGIPLGEEDWTAHQECDQFWFVLQNMMKHPISTRHRMTTYVPAWVPDESLTPQRNIERGKGALTPCHGLFTMFDIRGDYLDMTTVQASGDWLIGVPFNIVQYAFMQQLVAREVGKIPRKYHHTIVNAHVYSNQVPIIESSGLLDREPKQEKAELHIPEDWYLWDFSLEGIELRNYHYHPFIKFPVS